jgi:hypothetical protein
MNYEDLSPEVLEKAKACKTPEELYALAKEEGIELSEDEIAAVSGGVLPRPQDPRKAHCTDRQHGWRG